MNTSTDVRAQHTASTYTILWVFEAVATITFILRILSQSFLAHEGLGLEDALMAFGWTLNLSAAILATLSVKAMNVDISLALKLGLVSSALAAPALWFPKVSVALLLVRLMQPGKWVKIFFIVGPVLSLLLLCVPAVTITFVQCDPIPGQWDPERYKPTCWRPNIAVDVDIIANTSSSMFDFIYAIYPAIVFWKMRLATARKLQISILMGLGIISGAVGVYKTSLLPILSTREASLEAAVAGTHRIAMWTNIEVGIIISAACIPLSRPVYRLIMRNSQHQQEGIGNYRELPERMSERWLHLHPTHAQIYVRDDIEIQIDQRADLDGMTLSYTPKEPPA
ncbi:hypothetical protein UA08_08134 [Talaromyces atroroseus]|uniref:Rhodopsin domain-containing protein n=1 Tax=Talaromyces atroroseus TaxID=1441469 RepID=A0A225AEM3_TALAT|nr:hypothetical protein UA08_08134 [Talaromyces atroroseus]OKL56464.1 hypothetical protein UA08_08134 [Talaromyces atroroseus]